MKDLYDVNGYLNFRTLRELPYPFIIAIGGRGTGKTYGALKTCVEDHIFFGWLRRTQAQAELISRPEFSPIKPVCRDTGWKIRPASVAKGISAYYHYEEDNGKAVTVGAPLGINLALSTVANIRGFDASDLDMLIYDEAIPEPGEKPLKQEYEKLLNCYETMARNRELAGRPPLKFIALANPNKITAPILEGMRLVGILDRMTAKGRELYTDDRRGLALLRLQDSPISKAKADTALYRLETGTYADMAISNIFAYEDRGRIGSIPLAELVPVVSVGELTIYRHKSKRGLYYTTFHRSGDPPRYSTSARDIGKLLRVYSWLPEIMLSDDMIFESYEVQTLLTNYIM